MSANLALQKSVRGRLIATPGCTDLVPEQNILDRHARPAPDPSIIIGEGQSLDAGRIARNVQQIVLDLHIWKKEPSTEGSKRIAGAIRTALRAALPAVDGYTFTDCHVAGERFLRDPDGETSHGVVTVQAFASEAA